MLDFDKLDHALESAVGVAPDALLRAAASRWADRFLLARERLSELSEVKKLSPADTLERDRLASFFGCAYGDHGFLARAGTLHTLHARLRHVADALPALAHEPNGLQSLRREVSILRALAEHRLSQPQHPDDQPLHARLLSLDESLQELAGFAIAEQQARRSVSVSQSALRLYGLADLTNVASDIREGLPIAGVLSFVLGRLADRRFTQEARSLLHELCESHAGKLRDALWNAALESYTQRKSPPTLRELRELDTALEVLKSELTSNERAASDRADAVIALNTLLTIATAIGAMHVAAGMLDGAVLLIAEGLAAEGKIDGKAPLARPGALP